MVTVKSRIVVRYVSNKKIVRLSKSSTEGSQEQGLEDPGLNDNRFSVTVPFLDTDRDFKIETLGKTRKECSGSSQILVTDLRR